MVGEARRYGQKVFADILKQHKPDSAFVASCDEFFLSHALDNYTELNKQALFFIDGGQQTDLAPTTPKIEYRLAELSDIPTIEAISGDFLDDPQHSINMGEVHVGYHDNDMVAVGIIEHSQLWNKQASVGMFTHEAHRRGGIGTQTIHYLKQICHDTDHKPLAGCYYGNKLSQMTLQAAGMITVTRLLRFTFRCQPQETRT